MVASGSRTQPGDNRPLTVQEHTAIRALDRLAKIWPRTLTLASMGGSLVVMSSDDEAFQNGEGPERSEHVLHRLGDNIPNTGGDW
jgi:hypothetical protein